MPRAKYYKPNALRQVTPKNFYKYAPVIQQIVGHMKRLGAWYGDWNISSIQLWVRADGQVQFRHGMFESAKQITLPADIALEVLDGIARPDVYSILQKDGPALVRQREQEKSEAARESERARMEWKIRNDV